MKGLYSSDIFSALNDMVIRNKLIKYRAQAEDLLKRIQIIEDATYNQIKERDVHRIKSPSGRTKILEIIDSNYESFIFRMQTLQDLIVRVESADGDIASLFKDTAENIFERFVNKLESVLTASDAYKELPFSVEGIEVRAEFKKTKLLNEVREFLIKYPGVRGRLERENRFKQVIIHRIMSKDKTHLELAKMLGYRDRSSIYNIENTLMGIVKSYEGTFNERTERYLSNFLKGEYRYLFPDEEEDVLKNIARICGNNTDNIFNYLRRGKKNMSLTRGAVLERFARAGIKIIGSEIEEEMVESSV